MQSFFDLRGQSCTRPSMRFEPVRTEKNRRGSNREILTQKEDLLPGQNTV